MVLGFVAAGLLAAGLATADVIDSSLKVRLNFDAAPVGDVIVDTSPAAAHPGDEQFGHVGGGEAGRTGVMSFDGLLLNQIAVAPAAELNSPVGTIAFWMKSTNVTANPNAYAILFDRRSAGGDIIFQDPSGHLANQASQASGARANEQTTGANVTDGAWHHIAYVYDQSVSGSVTIYVDGIADTSKANSLAWSWVADLQLEIGASHDSFWSGFTGFLDDFRVYNRMLTAAEVANVAGLSSTPQIFISAGGQPQNLTVGDKDAPAFAVKATVVNGDPAQLSYQWQKDGVNIADATNSAYGFTASQRRQRQKVPRPARLSRRHWRDKRGGDAHRRTRDGLDL